MAETHLTFLELIQSHRRGTLLRQIESDLRDVLAAVQATGATGELTVKLPFKVNKAGQIECTPKITPKIPETPIGTGIYYLNEDAGLSCRDPGQADWVDDIKARRDA